MKKYDTPYGKKSGLLLMLSMEAHNRDNKAFELINKMIEKIETFAPTDATHDGLENCEIIAEAKALIGKRKKVIKDVEMRWMQTFG